MNESKKKDRYEDAKKFVRYSDGAKMYSIIDLLKWLEQRVLYIRLEQLREILY